MPALKYVGPFDEVDIPDAGVVSVKRGESFETDADTAEALLKQADNFQPVKAAKTTKES